MKIVSRVSSTQSYRIADELFTSKAAPSHNQKWQEITATEAPLIRSAIVRANSLKILDAPADSAYMQGIADALAYMRRLTD